LAVVVVLAATLQMLFMAAIMGVRVAAVLRGQGVRTVQTVQFVSSGPATPVASHRQIQGIYKWAFNNIPAVLSPRTLLLRPRRRLREFGRLSKLRNTLKLVLGLNPRLVNRHSHHLVHLLGLPLQT
jgi:hypothetical protein